MGEVPTPEFGKEKEGPVLKDAVDNAMGPSTPEAAFRALDQVSADAAALQEEVETGSPALNGVLEKATSPSTPDVAWRTLDQSGASSSNPEQDERKAKERRDREESERRRKELGWSSPLEDDI